jgi:hypothetical protein
LVLILGSAIAFIGSELVKCIRAKQEAAL